MTKGLLRVLRWAAYGLTGLMLFGFGLFHWIVFRLSTDPGPWYYPMQWYEHLTAGFSALTFAGMILLGVLVAKRQPRNPVGWLVLVSGSLGLIGGISYNYDTIVFSRTAPGLIFGGSKYLLWLGEGLGALHVTLIGLLFLIFPDGSLPSRRWRPFAGVFILLLTVRALDLLFGPSSIAAPLRIELLDVLRMGFKTGERYVSVNNLLRVLAVAIAAASLSIKMRSSEGLRHQQLKWLGLAAIFVATVALVPLGFYLSGGVSREATAVFGVARQVSLLVVAGATAVAILKYRLYDIDLVIRKGTVFAVLALFIGTVYLVAVLGLGWAFGPRVGSGSLPVLLTMASVAVGVHPVRLRARALASRMVFGERSEPYIVLADLTEQMANAPAPERLASDIASIAGRAVNALSCRAQILLPGAPDIAGQWTASRRPGGRSESWTSPILAEGFDIGSLEVVVLPGSLTRDDQGLLRQLADQTGSALANVRLTDQLSHTLEVLEEKAAELARSQERLLSAHATARDKLDREIAEGPRRRLEELSRQIERLSQSDGAGRDLSSEIQTLVDEAKLIWEDLRRFSRDISSGSVEEVGLSAALSTVIEEEDMDAALVLDEVVTTRRYPAEVESAIFETSLQVLRALASLDGVELNLAQDESVITFTISRKESATGGVPLEREVIDHVQDRIEAVGGSVDFGARRLIVSGRIPITTSVEVGSVLTA